MFCKVQSRMLKIHWQHLWRKNTRRVWLHIPLLTQRSHSTKNIQLEQKRTKSRITHQEIMRKIFQSSTSSPPWSISRGMTSCTGRLILVLSGRRRLNYGFDRHDLESVRRSGLSSTCVSAFFLPVREQCLLPSIRVLVE